mmetsp:Transcript_32041/g.43886  ORF Transcript_32041/g.43886 Transcript_32041/m.43886 type:complete len:170 (+) Transcript_32041:83-592(+)|eukprot:CAMPEP_0201490536 /NCGR_PEP_ID=MMETSP0151_2-20130828/26619_1 /ASSEMBLY_ACC=CAM_ASM_000257 /TAXON_ID=200890 /ORGANISM="Paramoeba atlantica, Strain 621/1 / CCAP 1560/9" /LENGTH=169 /DNA_ID=CAMNT_0047876531 /DNA_START=83 /DNA_END=592 /DNA_ORIENTATION=+
MDTIVPMEKEKNGAILFLDIDGVLCLPGAGMYQLDHKKEFHPPAVARLRELIEQTEAKIVVSSSWRKKKGLMESMTQKLEGDGGFPAGTIIGATPSLDRSKRDEEIGQWLSDHGYSFENDHWVVFDDSDSKFSGEKSVTIRKRLILVNRQKGISDGDCIQAKRKLTPKP